MRHIKSLRSTVGSAAARLWADRDGTALVEFAFAAPFLLAMTLGGLDLANYAVVKMRVSQLAIQVADNASRIGEGDQLSGKKITETQINDLLTGAVLQAGALNIYGTYSERTPSGGNVTKNKARIIISSLQPVANPNTTSKFMIGWQRCGGLDTSYTPQYGTYGQASGQNMAGMGPAGRQVTAPDGGAMIFVEVHYRYEPIVLGKFGVMPYSDLNEIATMIVRDDRDYTQIYNTEGAPVSSC